MFLFLFIDVSSLHLTVSIRYCCLFRHKSDQDLCWYHLLSELLWLAASSVQWLLLPFAVSHFLGYLHTYDLFPFLSEASIHVSQFQNYVAVSLSKLFVLSSGPRDLPVSQGLKGNWSISFLILYPIIVNDKYVQSTLTVISCLFLFHLLPLSGNVNNVAVTAMCLRVVIAQSIFETILSEFPIVVREFPIILISIVRENKDPFSKMVKNTLVSIQKVFMAFPE